MKRFILRAFLIVLIANASPHLLHAFDGEVHSLPNGLKVILVKEPKAPVVTFQVWYRVGSRNEVLGQTGLSHLLEHMMFKGTPTHGKGEFSRIIARNGGTENAFTSRDYTAYFENLASDRIELSIDLESDRMRNILLDPEEFRLEREVVKEERRLRTDDDPYASLIEQMFAVAFLVHTYHSPTIGWMEDLNRLTVEDARRHYDTYYRPNNATLVIVGDIEPRALMKRIRKTFGKIPKGPEPPTVPVPEPPQQGERRIVVKREAQLPLVVMGYKAPNYREEDAYALEVLATILSAGKSSRIYQSLVYEDKISLEAGGEYGAGTADPNLFYFYALAQPGHGPDVLEKGLQAVLERIRTEPVSQRELRKAKNQIEAGHIFGQDSNFYRAMLIGKAETIGAGVDFLDRYLQRIRKVTAEDIQRVARTYLREDTRTVGILIPLKPKE